MKLPRPLFPSLLLTVLLTLTACGSPFTDAPPVADSTLVSALAELHLAQARLRLRHQGRLGDDRNRTRTRPDTATIRVPPALRDSILARYGLSERRLRAALDYYTEHPEQYTAIYDRVVDTLNAEHKALRFSGDTPPGTPPEERPTPQAFQ